MKLSISETSHLRLLEESDARELHQLIEANRAYLARFEDTLDFIRRTQAQLTDNDGFQAAIIIKGASPISDVSCPPLSNPKTRTIAHRTIGITATQISQ